MTKRTNDCEFNVFNTSNTKYYNVTGKTDGLL